MISGPILLLELIIAGDVQYKSSATYPPSSSNRRRATHHSAPPSQRPNTMKGSRRNHGRGTASAALKLGVAIFLASVVSRTGRAAISPVNGEGLAALSPGEVRPAAI